MTLDEIRLLDNRALDRVIAEALEPPPHDLTKFWNCHGPFWKPIRYVLKDSAMYAPSPFSTDLNACAEAEQELRRGCAKASVARDAFARYEDLISKFSRARQRAEVLAAVLTEGGK